MGNVSKAHQIGRQLPLQFVLHMPEIVFVHGPLRCESNGFDHPLKRHDRRSIQFTHQQCRMFIILESRQRETKQFLFLLNIHKTDIGILDEFEWIAWIIDCDAENGKGMTR